MHGDCNTREHSSHAIWDSNPIGMHGDCNEYIINLQEDEDSNPIGMHGDCNEQVKELTQKCERENLARGMEEYYLTQKISDFEKLCENNGIDFGIVNELDKKRRHLPSAKKEPVTEEQFLSVFTHYYPHAYIHNVDDGDFDDIWVRAKGYWEADRILYSRSDKEIRMWRTKGQCDYKFNSIKEFEDWLAKAHFRDREFEREGEATTPD